MKALPLSPKERRLKDLTPYIMINIGLTGGMASGKNFAASVFEELGCRTIDADALSRQAIAPGGIAAGELLEVFGSSILKGVGAKEYINAESGAFQDEYLELRSALRKLIAGDSEKRLLLEKIVHPAVEKLYAAERKRIARKDSSSVLVYHAPLLTEAYLKDTNPADRAEMTKDDFKAKTPFDIIILIWTSRETALKRLALRAFPPFEEGIKLLNAQLPFEEKVRFADHIIDNDRNMECTRADIKRVFSLIKMLCG
ncbi:MAG: dephospho-CoA kinase [Deferribacteraceae bacterium]|nr:dephospho-CoA kinase [Deferribacteraceae bacterium]